jgi:hypothetical protein
LNKVDNCGRPLQFFWSCSSTTSSDCTHFLDVANGPAEDPHTTNVAYLTVNELDSYDITMTVCVAGTNECAPRLARWYAGAEIS